MYYGWTNINNVACRYTSFLNKHTKAVYTLENGPGIPIDKIQNKHN